MKLRTSKKPKQNDDFEVDLNQENTRTKQGGGKGQNARDSGFSGDVSQFLLKSIQNSNMSNENEHGNKHKLRNSVSFLNLIHINFKPNFSPTIIKANTKK